jgi:ABC-type arginine transport system permease subunit
MAVALLGQTGFASPLVQAYTVLFRAVPLILLRLLIWNGPPDSILYSASLDGLRPTAGREKHS